MMLKFVKTSLLTCFKTSFNKFFSVYEGLTEAATGGVL